VRRGEEIIMQVKLRSVGVRSRSAAATAAFMGVVLVGCGVGGQTSAGNPEAATVSGAAGSPTEATAAPSTVEDGTDAAGSSVAAETAEETSPQAPRRRAVERAFTDGGKGFLIDDVTGSVPDGYVQGHIRNFYIYLGSNEGDGHVAWLSIAAPRVTKMGPWGPDATGMPAPYDLPAELAPADMRRVLDERDVPVREWGELSVDAITTPVVTVEGHLDICASPPAGLPASRAHDCRFNDGNGRFYVFIPYLHGTLVAEGAVKREVMAGELPTAEEMSVVVDELQSWADTIDLP
jgi:hypothetical protein